MLLYWCVGGIKLTCHYADSASYIFGILGNWKKASIYMDFDFTPPRYDDVYFEAMTKLDELIWSQVDLDEASKQVLYQNLWKLYTTN